MTVLASGRRLDVIFVLLMLAAVLLRLQLATSRSYIHDEENTSIPLSKTISFAPGHLNLPLRGENHPALPAYVVKASSTLFGTTPLAYRSLHVLAGLITILMVFGLTRQWYGPVAARWAAALLAFNEYFLAVSSRATAHAPHLLLVTTSVYAFSRFLATERAVYLYGAGAAAGLAFYCKEHSALLLLVFLATLLIPRHRRWLRGPHAYLACVVFVLVISPDLYWNLTTDANRTLVTYGDQPAMTANYWSHLQRIGGLGFSPYPTMFYARDVVRSVHLRVTGNELRDETEEYESVNPALGALLLAALLITAVRPAGGDHLRSFLLLLFWGVFGFFTLIARGSPPGRLDPVSWIWVESTMIPAVILTGARLAGATGRLRIAAWALSAVALMYAGWWMLR